MTENKSEKQTERTCADCACSPVCSDSPYGYDCFWWQPQIIHCGECQFAAFDAKTGNIAACLKTGDEYPRIITDFCSLGEKTREIIINQKEKV